MYRVFMRTASRRNAYRAYEVLRKNGFDAEYRTGTDPVTHEVEHFVLVPARQMRCNVLVKGA